MKERFVHRAIVTTICVLTAVAGWSQPAAKENGTVDLPSILDEVMACSQVDAGNTARLQRVLTKARRGEPVVVSVIGGSITQGAVTTKPEFVYGNRIAQWWRETFPKADIEFVNAGIGATGSEIGAHRAGKHLLSHNPDFVVVEYAVNDRNTPLYRDTFEGLVRQILNHPKQPAVVALFTMHSDGGNTQDTHEPICRHYGIPMVSFRDALWPEVQAKHIAWEDIEADAVHPNDQGHAYCATFVTFLLDALYKRMPDDASLSGMPGIPPVPTPLHTDLFEFATFRSLGDITPITSKGWTSFGDTTEERYFKAGWKADTPGSEIEFQIDAEAVGILFYRIKGAMGIAEAQIDDGDPVRMDAHFDADWGGYTPYELVARDLAPGPHTLRITLTDERDENSTGHEFRIHAVMLARTRG
ncbi:MAG: SGNH/GDSL hydrolase family protein [bacterium]|nr:SGNH/GDSL hydrolase family protein [bacterium]